MKDASSPVMRWQACLQAARPPFLLLAPLCVLLGVGAARAEGLALSWWDVWLALLGSVTAHAAVNLLNEHHDFRSGLDAMTRRTPFSGGSGALLACPRAAPLAAVTAAACLVVTALIGGYFLAQRGPAMLIFGIAGLALVWGYSGWIVRRPWLCLLAPGVGFGVLMVLGSHWAVGGRLGSTVLAVAPVPILLVSALLLVNQLPDIDADRRVGRRHLAIVLGVSRAAQVAAWLNAAAFVSLMLAIGLNGVPRAVWPALLPGLAAAWLIRGLYRLDEREVDGDRRRLLPLMATQVAILLITLAVLDLSLWWSA
ncbi:prenyltransferase [Halomonas sp. McH1-25]|uniref:prenyltransferase n=1 Tax=unclassified Halomonas TaxID=2609666 RepID=UPI001EF44620|nr:MULTISPECIES: prenyltransferase [unclassified Halomonas]MCG7600564.1 prenyltransferase [Halomonas sp. McH1-25]MCP1342031.1 prenyltransferase [Halomonas sp. FL8]